MVPTLTLGKCRHYLKIRGESKIQVIIFVSLHLQIRPYSSTDRMSDSGSDDLGSNPGRVTKTPVRQ